MDLKNFKKVGATKSHTIFEHPDGHVIHISTKNIPKHLQKDMKKMDTTQKMADGGNVEEETFSPSAALTGHDVAASAGMTGEEVAPSAMPQEVPSFDPGQLSIGQQAAQQVPDLPVEPQPVPEQQQQAAPNPIEGFPGYNEQKTGILGAAQAESQYAKEAAAKYHQAVVNEQAVQQELKKGLADKMKDIEAVTQDIRQAHINPNHYQESMTTGDKVRTTIGLLLGGIGSGILKGKNPAEEYLNKQIERDIDAQKANIGNKHNLLTALEHQYKDKMVAEDMFRAIRANTISHQINEAAMKSKSPMAMSNAQMAIGKLQEQYMPYLQRANMVQMFNHLGNSGQSVEPILNQLRVIDPAAAKGLEERYVPGVGVGSVPVPAKERSTLNERQSLQEQVTRLRDWANKNSGTMSPAKVAEGRTMAKLVQDAYRRANGQGVFREAEAEFVNGIVEAHPDKFLNSMRVDPKYQALEQANLHELNTLKKSFGLPVQEDLSSLKPAHRQAFEFARANPQSKQSQAILQRLGINARR